jgi:antitoxin HicB
MWAYPVRLARDDNDTLLVTCPAFPEVTTFGADVPDALAHARDAIEEAIAARMADREPIPPPRPGGRYRVALPAQTVAKILLYQTMREEKVSKARLARSLGWHRPQVDRLLNLRHGTRMDAIETAFGALGRRVRIEVEETAD